MGTAKFDYIGDKEVIGLFFQNYEAAINRSWVPRLAATFTTLAGTVLLKMSRT